MAIQIDYFEIIKAAADPNCPPGGCNGEGIIHGSKVMQDGTFLPYDFLCSCTWSDENAKFAMEQINRMQVYSYV